MTYLGVTLLAGGLVIAVTHAAARPIHWIGTWLAVIGLGTYGIVLAVRPEGLLWSDGVVVWVSGGAGTLLGRSLKQPGAIVAFCVTIAVVDLLSFGGGLTRAIIDGYAAGTSDLLRYLAFSIIVDGRIVPVVGVGDLLMVSTLFVALRGVGVRAAGAAALLLAGLGAALLVGVAIGGAPGLPFLAAGVILFLGWRQRRGQVGTSPPTQVVSDRDGEADRTGSPHNRPT